MSIAVLIADQKGVPTLRPGRTSFLDTLQTSAVLMVGCPLDEMADIFGEEELKRMQPIASLVNVVRGG